MQFEVLGKRSLSPDPLQTWVKSGNLPNYCFAVLAGYLQVYNTMDSVTGLYNTVKEETRRKLLADAPLDILRSALKEFNITAKDEGNREDISQKWFSHMVGTGFKSLLLRLGKSKIRRVASTLDLEINEGDDHLKLIVDAVLKQGLPKFLSQSSDKSTLTSFCKALNFDKLPDKSYHMAVRGNNNNLTKPGQIRDLQDDLVDEIVVLGVEESFKLLSKTTLACSYPNQSSTTHFQLFVSISSSHRRRTHLYMNSQHC